MREPSVRPLKLSRGGPLHRQEATKKQSVSVGLRFIVPYSHREESHGAMRYGHDGNLSGPWAQIVREDSAMSDAAACTDESTWAVHFPGNLRWSNAMQIVKGMVPYAAVAMDEIDRVGRRLKARAAEPDLDQVWREEWAAMADHVVAVADKAAEEGREIT